jgi:hypothetical protein
MPEGGLERRLERIESRQDTMLETLSVIREKVTATNGHVEDLAAEVGRVPAWETRGDRKPITDRLHNIEAVVTPTAMRAAFLSALDSRRASTWTKGQKVATMAGVLIGAVAAVLRFAGYGG